MDLAVGQIRDVEHGIPCLEVATEELSGSATWEADRTGRIRIHTGKGSAIVGAGLAGGILQSGYTDEGKYVFMLLGVVNAGLGGGAGWEANGSFGGSCRIGATC